MAISFNLPDIGRRIMPEETGVPDYVKALSAGLDLGAKPAQLTQKLLAQTLANKINQAKAQYAERNEAANLANTEAGTGLTLENTIKQQLLNRYLPEREPAEIEEIKQRANYYGMGGAGGSTGSKDFMAYSSGVAADNPHLNPAQLREAADVLAKGGTQLADGTPLNPMSIGTETAFNRAIKAGTTAAQINTMNLANQADAELDVFSNLASKWSAPYGDTVFGKSPKQIVDSFKTDDKSQTQLGRLIAANALQFEQAQIRNRIAGGQPGITSTQELMRESQQHIKTVFPKLSNKARQVANDSLNEAIKAGLSARNKVGAGAGAVYKKQYEQPSQNAMGKTGTSILMRAPDGTMNFVAVNNIEKAKSLGLVPID